MPGYSQVHVTWRYTRDVIGVAEGRSGGERRGSSARGENGSDGRR